MAYALVCLSALGAVLGEAHAPRVLLKAAVPKLVCSTLVFLAAHWPCALYGLSALLLPCGADTPDDEPRAPQWAAAVVAANGPQEVREVLWFVAGQLELRGGSGPFFVWQFSPLTPPSFSLFSPTPNSITLRKLVEVVGSARGQAGSGTPSLQPWL